MDAHTVATGVGLVRYDAMRRAIVEAHEIDEIKDLRDKALALEMYARQANDHESERRVHDIRERAERRAGQLLKATPRAPGGRPTENPSDATRGLTPPIKPLAELGISYDQSSQWQKLADVPEEDFEAALANPVALASTEHIIAAHEAKTKPPKPVPKPDPNALWVWGRLIDFEERGVMDLDPAALIELMNDHMRDTATRLAPKLADWLKRIAK